MSFVDKAREIAEKAHRGQKRKHGTKEDYINHPKRVADSLEDDNHKAVAWLHDVLEDTAVTLSDLAGNFPPDVVSAVQVLTKQKDENYFDFITRVSENSIARAVKIKDLEDNMSDLGEGDMKDVYRFAHYVLRGVENRK